jgi:hypothetical protein
MRELQRLTKLHFKQDTSREKSKRLHQHATDVTKDQRAAATVGPVALRAFHHVSSAANLVCERWLQSRFIDHHVSRCEGEDRKAASSVALLLVTKLMQGTQLKRTA